MEYFLGTMSIIAGWLLGQASLQVIRTRYEKFTCHQIWRDVHGFESYKPLCMLLIVAMLYAAFVHATPVFGLPPSTSALSLEEWYDLVFITLFISLMPWFILDIMQAIKPHPNPDLLTPSTLDESGWRLISVEPLSQELICTLHHPSAGKLRAPMQGVQPVHTTSAQRSLSRIGRNQKVAITHLADGSVGIFMPHPWGNLKSEKAERYIHLGTGVVAWEEGQQTQSFVIPIEEKTYTVHNVLPNRSVSRV
ncbi:hypothetical protein Deipr_2389 (plasmid) [Deinococcus proteolyticus MRP]|uniref:Uncharacterized protein n=1 Tax=Deinococcus proteolyticus (strain ATCC 35074 / DSM 20540 / JCM 6276 / NBRC 101906 / NCIMB 13154 / VKM Ac-1939 / CCM 2703 / MRP) TaxID=693977 RepID=F0RQF4_DEIPM|nr:hypothetical protein [Deinococcus proteolyticus]ADY27513.1 hypothetical protein Deipr_2389 [Deinococcus proteolyticus MRP]